MSKIVELAKKLKALSDRGEGGEKFNATIKCTCKIKLVEYKGKLYGKVGKKYFPLENTTDDFETLQRRVDELSMALTSLRKRLL